MVYVPSQLPNILDVVVDGAVAGEVAQAGGIEEGLLRPEARLLVDRFDFLVHIAIGAEISQHEERIATI